MFLDLKPHEGGAFAFGDIGKGNISGIGKICIPFLASMDNFPKVWELKTITIQEAKDLKNLAWDELLGILRVHEVHLQT